MDLGIEIQRIVHQKDLLLFRLEMVEQNKDKLRKEINEIKNTAKDDNVKEINELKKMLTNKEEE